MDKRLDIPYSQHIQDHRRMDVFMPDKGNRAAILFVHGGGWCKGARTQWHAVAEHFCNRGFICASASYRLAPQFRYPAQVQDVRLAMAYVLRSTRPWGFDADKVAAVGSSAGGHLVAMLSTIAPDDPLGTSPEIAGADTRPAATVCYCPVTQLGSGELPETVGEAVGKLMGCPQDEAPDLYSEASPIERVTGDEPPFLFLHGDADGTVPLEHSTKMAERLVDKGAEARVEVLSGVDHGFGYGVSTDAQKAAVAEMETFLDQVFGLG